MVTQTDLHYNPLDPETLLNPYPVYARLRENAPVFWHGGMKSWVLTRYADCKEVLQNYHLFARDQRRVGRDYPNVRHNVQALDPPDNLKLRNLLLKAINSLDIEDIRKRVHNKIQDAFEKQESKTKFDFMREVSAPLSLSLSAILVGMKNQI